MNEVRVVGSLTYGSRHRPGPGSVGGFHRGVG